ncbi:MAG: hypothetical protein KatS3mg131_0241 [Candidatus Tectimicrobiota bacterium]|nr:MAG: hypothetical protein KatS3mg131_0241 [Candidatus Tectomicrobia bacterium]
MAAKRKGQPPVAPLPAGYKELLESLKARIRSAQVRAALAANRELVLLYWQIGREILQRQQQEGWGAKVVERLARDLKREFPEMKGFSPRVTVQVGQRIMPLPPGMLRLLRAARRVPLRPAKPPHTPW